MFIKTYLKQEAQAPEGGVAPVAQPVKVPSVDTPVVVPSVQAPETPTEAPVLTDAPVAKPTPITYKDSAAKQVGDMLTAAGVDPAQARDAFKANEGQCTPEIYAALVEKHGEGMASLLAGQMSKLHSDDVAKSAAADKAVYTQLEEAFKGVTEQSGEQTFKELNTWATTNITNEDRKELNAAIKQGGFVAKLAVQELVNAFQQSGDYSQEMVGVDGDNQSAIPKGGYLTRAQYTTELDALLAKGHVYGQSPEIKALDARRTRSAMRGM